MAHQTILIFIKYPSQNVYFLPFLGINRRDKSYEKDE
ncbi:hypothetical protein SAMN05192533_11840 [Mesobacillus persicus]|uniref:Uncharacterized protein n=1 Tax=Mesobacillus persicus TaxID=930146 RepID=A0A1H8IR99_9BACI|nr:hypothetical protein SAMN05192533_11840 [Mesobacillus persicus]